MLQSAAADMGAALASPWVCNNPGYTNLSGVSELSLVDRRGSVCGGCKMARWVFGLGWVFGDTACACALALLQTLA